MERDTTEEELEKALSSPEALVNMSSESIENLLSCAARNGISDAVARILSETNADVNAGDSAGSTPLIYASAFGHPEIVNMLVEHGAQCDLQDANEWTALMWAINNGHLEIVKTLLSHGASLGVRTSTGRSALDFCSPGSVIFQYLEANNLIDENTGDLEFYVKPKFNPEEMAANIERQLQESSKALGLPYGEPRSSASSFVAGGLVFDFETYNSAHALKVGLGEIPNLLDKVITDVRPVISKRQRPTSANTIFLAARFFHYNNMTGDLVDLFSPICRRVLDVVERDPQDLALACYWLANINILLYYLQRDPGTRKSTCEFRLALEELMATLANTVTHCVEQLLAPLVLPCLLDYESIPGISEIEYRGWKPFHRAKTVVSDALGDAEKGVLPPSMDALRKPAPRKVTAILSSLQVVLDIFLVHPLVAQNLYSQLLYWLGSSVFNLVIGKRKYLSRTRAMQIRLNLSSIEDWCGNNNFRPETDQNTSPYRSILEICRFHFAAINELLQWLQVYTGLDGGGASAEATLVEFRSLTPVQVASASKMYRCEINEPEPKRSYKESLSKLAALWEVPETLEPKPPVYIDSKPILSREVHLDTTMQFATVLPNLREMTIFWGAHYADAARERFHCVPSVSNEFVDVFEGSKSSTADVYEEVEIPQASHRRDEEETTEWGPEILENPW